jgi:hypothetical protein
MKTEALIEDIKHGGESASKRLDKIDPKLKRKFDSAIMKLQEVIADVMVVYPDANYYVQEDEVIIMLGDSHTALLGTNNLGRANFSLNAYSSSQLTGRIGGGGW